MIGLPMTSISTALGYPYSTDYQALKVPRLQIQTLLHRLLDGRRRPVIGSSFRIGRFRVRLKSGIRDLPSLAGISGPFEEFWLNSV